MAVGGKVNFEVDDGAFIGQRENCVMCNKTEHDGYCFQCETYICQICFDNHLKLKSCKDHVLLRDSHEIKTHDSAIRFETCDEHKQQEVKAYCTEHKCCVCIECILLRHKSCEWEYIIDASNRFQDSGDLARMLETVQSLEYTLDKCMEAIDKHTKTAETINKDVVSNVESFTKSLVEYVAESKQQVLDDAKMREAAHQDKLDKLKVDIQSLGSKVEEIITDFRNEDILHKRFILAVETMPKVARIQDELAAIDCNNVANDYTFRPRNFLKRMMSNTRPIGRLTDASQTEEDEEDDEDINLKKERERSQGLEQQLEDNQKMITKLKKEMYDMEQTHANVIVKINKDLADTKQNYDNVIVKINKDLADTKQNYDGRISKLKQELDDVKQHVPRVTLSCGHENFVGHLGENRLITCCTCGIINGDQPNGTFTTDENSRALFLNFKFRSGTQSKLNRNPEQPYSGTTVTGCLLNNTEGQIIRRMMNIAFQRKCLFTVNNDGNIQNGVELITFINSWYRGYILRVKKQLEERGIKESDVTQS